MDWIAEHLQIIIAVAGIIAYWINARRKEKAGEAADYDGDGEPDVLPRTPMREGEQDMQHAENTRRIQEEIRRKIAERQGGGAPTPAPARPPALPTPSPVMRREDDDWARRAETRRIEAERESAKVMERQHALAEQLAALKARRAEQSEAKAAWTQTPATGAATASRKKREHDDLLGDLRDARSLRKAIITREVLGTPVGLR